MPGTLPFSGARYPLASEADNVPADLLRFGTDIDPQLVLKASSEADRNARFSDVPEGTLVSCNALGLLWQKTTTPPTAAAWRVLAQNGAALTSGVATAQTGWTVSAQYAKVVSGLQVLKLAFGYSGASDIVANGPTDPSAITPLPGGLVDQQIGTLAVAKPPLNWPCHARTTIANGTVVLRYTDGAVILSDLNTSGRIRNGDFVEFAATYPI